MTSTDLQMMKMRDALFSLSGAIARWLPMPSAEKFVLICEVSQALDAPSACQDLTPPDADLLAGTDAGSWSFGWQPIAQEDDDDGN